MSDPPPRLCLPLKITLSDESVAIRDAANTSISWIYFDDGCAVRRSVRQRLTKGDAIEVAKVVARALTKRIGGNEATWRGISTAPLNIREFPPVFDRISL